MIYPRIFSRICCILVGDRTAKDEGRLTLNPFAHLDPYISIILPILCVLSNLPVIGGAKPVPVDSNELKGGKWGMVLVAMAGPISNFRFRFRCFHGCTRIKSVK